MDNSTSPLVPTIATRAVVSAPPGEPAALTLFNGAGVAIATLMLAPPLCASLAIDLLATARPPTRARAATQRVRPVRNWTIRHERFCQAMARGKALAKASAYAGWDGDRGNAWHIAQRPNVQARIQEIRAEIARQVHSEPGTP